MVSSRNIRMISTTHSRKHSTWFVCKEFLFHFHFHFKMNSVYVQVKHFFFFALLFLIRKMPYVKQMWPAYWNSHMENVHQIISRIEHWYLKSTDHLALCKVYWKTAAEYKKTQTGYKLWTGVFVRIRSLKTWTRISETSKYPTSQYQAHKKIPNRCHKCFFFFYYFQWVHNGMYLYSFIIREKVTVQVGMLAC